MINIPTDTASRFLGLLSDQIADVGTLKIIAVAIAIPLLFYIMHKLAHLWAARDTAREKKELGL